MRKIFLTTSLVVSFLSLANKPARSYCVYIANQSGSSLEIEAKVADQYVDIWTMKVKELDPGANSNACWNWQDVYAKTSVPETGILTVSHLNIKELQGKFNIPLKPNNATFQNAGWATISIASGANSNQLDITITGYEENGAVLSTSTITANKKGKVMYKK